MRVVKTVFALLILFVGKSAVSDKRVFELIENADCIERGLTVMCVNPDDGGKFSPN
jgi:hypothetical protein